MTGAARRGVLLALAGAVGAAAWWRRPVASRTPPNGVTLDLGGIPPGTQHVLAWNGHPVFVVHRTAAALTALRQAASGTLLLDPESRSSRQPEAARNWHRSLVPEIGVYVGVCTHLGCTPRLEGALYHCPCHGSRFDLAGRVYAGAPARLNLAVPPHAIDGATLRLGAAA